MTPPDLSSKPTPLHDATSTAVRPILPFGTPSLKERAADVHLDADPDLRRDAAAVQAALAAFRAVHGFGRGTAAPQIGIGKRIIALAIPGWPDIIVNPAICWHSEERQTLWDDCMCFPDIMVRVARYKSVSVEFRDLSGKAYRKGPLAFAESELLQHEIDHLDGKLSFDRAIGDNAFVHRSAFDADRAYFASLVDYAPDAP